MILNMDYTPLYNVHDAWFVGVTHAC